MVTGRRRPPGGLDETLDAFLEELEAEVGDSAELTTRLELRLCPEAQELLLFLGHAGSALGAGAVPPDAPAWRWLEADHSRCRRGRAGSFADRFIVTHALEMLSEIARNPELGAPASWRRAVGRVMPRLEAVFANGVGEVEVHHLREGVAAVLDGDD